MRNTRIIHSLEDIYDFFCHADALGLQVLENTRLSAPKEAYIPRDCFRFQKKGAFYLLREDWIFGPMKFGYITNNPNFEPFYDLRPRVNYIALDVFFSAQREYPEGKRLGLGSFGCPKSWISDPGIEVFATPPVVKETYEELSKQMRKGGEVISNRHQRYLVMRDAKLKLASRGYLMPIL